MCANTDIQHSGVGAEEGKGERRMGPAPCPLPPHSSIVYGWKRYRISRNTCRKIGKQSNWWKNNKHEVKLTTKQEEWHKPIMVLITMPVDLFFTSTKFATTLTKPWVNFKFAYSKFRWQKLFLLVCYVWTVRKLTHQHFIFCRDFSTCFANWIIKNHNTVKQIEFLNQSIHSLSYTPQFKVY